MNKLRILFNILIVIILSVVVSVVVRAAYNTGASEGYEKARVEAQAQIDDLTAMIRSGAISYKNEELVPTPKPQTNTIPQSQKPTAWGGPELWTEVNKRRVELGVNSLSQRDELCTIASIRLNELLELGKLDGHAGFSKLEEMRTDLKWVFEKYNISEFLVSGARTPQEAVSLWENTLGHKKLLTGGEYVWGCIYAQESFAVAITAY